MQNFVDNLALYSNCRQLAQNKIEIFPHKLALTNTRLAQRTPPSSGRLLQARSNSSFLLVFD